MFRVAAADLTYRRSVTVPVPTPDGGVEEHRYTAHFVILSSSRTQELAGAGDAALVRAVVRGWDDVADASGGAIAFTPGALGRLVEIPYWLRATALAYIDFAAGAPAKNSAVPPATS